MAGSRSVTCRWGTLTLDISAPGYVAQTVPVAVQFSATSTVNVNLAPVASTQPITVSLTWGARPDDLDIHLSGPSSGGSRFHLYWNNPNAAPNAALTADADSGYGPESVVIKPSTSTGSWVAGEYHVWAHNYSGTPGFGDSAATVTVKRGDQVIGIYNVTSASGTSSQPLWRSVNITVDTGGNVSSAPAQTFVSGGSSTTLRIDDGSNSVLEWPAAAKKPRHLGGPTPGQP